MVHGEWFMIMDIDKNILKLKVYIISAFLLLNLNCSFAHAQEYESSEDSCAIVSNSLWSNWFGQLGMDMSLMNPYGSNFANVFPKGMSFGVDAALGKWFTPEFGGRARINLENAFLQSDKAEWWKNCPDGCLILNGDFLIDVFNFFGGYKPDRKWTLIMYPRTGAFINLGSGKGSPILGLIISLAEYRCSALTIPRGAHSEYRS